MAERLVESPHRKVTFEDDFRDLVDGDVINGSSCWFYDQSGRYLGCEDNPDHPFHLENIPESERTCDVGCSTDGMYGSRPKTPTELEEAMEESGSYKPVTREQFVKILEGLGTDVVNQSHYTDCGIEPIEIIESLGDMIPYCRGNVLKYIMRYDKKNGLEDLHKARVYLDWLISAVEERN